MRYRSSTIRLSTCLTPITLACIALLARAEDEPPPAAADTIAVTGFKSANAKAIAAKRNAELTVDSVAADDIGKLPDFNVGDAVRRVTGVDVLTYQGEPRYAVIRGMDANYNETQIDGFAIASNDVGSRQVLMEMLPSNFAHRIDVTKTYLPQSSGGAIGGILDIVTESGYSVPNNTLTLSAKAGQNLMPSEYGGHTPTGEIATKWGRRFGAEDQYALLLAASYWFREIHVPQNESGGTLNGYNTNGTQASSPYGGDGFAVPTERRWYNYDNMRERGSLTARFDFRPSETLSGHVGAYLFHQHEKSDRNMQLASVNAGSKVSNQTADSGTLTSANQLVELGQLRWDRQLYGINGDVDYQFAPEWQADLRASFSRSPEHNPQTWDRFTQSGMAFNYQWDGSSSPLFTPVNAAAAANPALYKQTYHRNEATQYTSTVNDVQFDLKKNDSADAEGLGYAVGARAVSSDISTSFARTSWSGMNYTLANVLDGSALCGLACNAPMMAVNAQAAATAFQQNVSGATAAVDTASQYGGTYGVNELVSATYAQARYKSGPWMTAGGLRYEHTSERLNGWLQTNGNWAPTTTTSSYDNLLLSWLALYDTSANGKLRMGVSETVGRPRFDQIAPTGGVLNTSSSPATLTQGNPALKPRQSTNFDLGHDWYLDKGRGIVSVAVFYKDIRNEIFKYGQTESLAINGTPTNVLVTEPQNSPHPVHVTGIEFGFSKDLDFVSPRLKGFGVSGNATFMHVSYPVTLTNGSVTNIGTMPE
ncbi:MAG: TonB-dependent receptor, partial [Burkholderiales bacterium]|nr:TonB-dependent receptor [Burkholderiales bacterium]